MKIIARMSSIALDLLLGSHAESGLQNAPRALCMLCLGCRTCVAFWNGLGIDPAYLIELLFFVHCSISVCLERSCCLW